MPASRRLLHTLLGELPPASGHVRIMPGAEIAFYRQDLSNVDPDTSMYDLIAHRRGMWTRGQIQGHLGRFGFSGDEVLRKAGMLSGGERARVALALMMLEHANLLVFDEPTNHLDVESIEALEDAIAGYDGTVLMVSHDRALLTSLCTRIWAIEDGRVRDYPGTFDEWEADRAARQRAAAVVNARANAALRAAAPLERPRRAAVTDATTRRQLEGEVADAEQRVATLEVELARLEAGLADPTIYQDAGGIGDWRRLADERERVRAELDSALSRWTAAAARLEQQTG